MSLIFWSHFAHEGSKALSRCSTAPQELHVLWVFEKADGPELEPRLPHTSCRNLEKSQTLFEPVSSAGKWAAGRCGGNH